MSIAGVAVCIGLLLLGFRLKAPLIVPLFASFVFGSTAIATLGFMGDSSPLIFVVFAGILVFSVPFRKHSLRDLAYILSRSWVPWIVIVFTIYAVAGAVILPRVFAGQVSVFVPSREAGGLFELPLAPVSANITQAAYLVIGALSFFAVSILLVQQKNLELIHRGFLTFCILLAIVGTIDLAAKAMGMGDVFKIVRSANYVMHTNAEQAGFHRLTGMYTEASVFGSATLAALAFTFTYWRRTGISWALFLSAVLGVLLLLSTSTTAYVGAAIVALPVVVSETRSLLAGRLSRPDLGLLAFALICLTVALSIYIYRIELLAPFIELFDSALLNKSQSASAHERTQWNLRSIQSFFDTAGLGTGLGSSRSSSWIISVLSQLGLIGTLLLSFLVAQLMKRQPEHRRAPVKVKAGAVHDSVRAFILAGLVAMSIGGGGADPGVVFFISLATVLACREPLSIAIFKRQLSVDGGRLNEDSNSNKRTVQ